MYQLHAAQIKAARAMLGWSQEQMAQEAGLAVTTIRNMEMGYIPRGRTAEYIRLAIENAGLEFTESEGIRRRKDINVYQGENGTGLLFEDIRQTIGAKGGEVITIMHSQEMLAHSCGVGSANVLERLMRLGKLAPVKCLLPETAQADLQVPQFQFRTISDKSLRPLSFYVYGNKFVHVLPEENLTFRFVVITSAAAASNHRAHFLALWEDAMPIAARISA